MKRLLLLLLTLFLLGFRQQLTVADVCPRFGLPATGDGHSNDHAYRYTQVAGQRILALPADDSFWIGYKAGGLADDYWQARVRTLTLWMFMQDGDERRLMAYHNRDNPDVVFVLIFQTMDWFADANGDHYGQHPCAAIRVQRDVFEAMMSNLERIP